MKNPIRKLLFIIFYLLAPRCVLATSTSKEWQKSFADLYCMSRKIETKLNVKQVIDLFESMFNHKKLEKCTLENLTELSCRQIYFYIRELENTIQLAAKTPSSIFASLPPPIWLVLGLIIGGTIGYLAHLFFNTPTKSIEKE